LLRQELEQALTGFSDASVAGSAHNADAMELAHDNGGKIPSETG
jgi:hypothetical protein